MIIVSAERDIKVPARNAWNLLSKFDDIGWASDLGRDEYEGKGVGMIRRMYVVPGSPTIERLDSRDHENMEFTNSVVEGMPMPIEDYSASVSVTPVGTSSCSIRWISKGRSTDAPSDEVESTLNQFLDSLLQMVENHLLANAK